MQICFLCGATETILGLLLFILYVNDLLRDIPEGSILFYTDDTSFLVKTCGQWRRIK